MRRWLQDPSRLLTRLLPLITSFEEATSFVRYFADRGQQLTDGTTGLVLGGNEISALFSFVLEERAGRDLLEHYRGHLATPGEHGPTILGNAMALPVDPTWTERLLVAGLAVVDHRDRTALIESTWGIVLSDEPL